MAAQCDYLPIAWHKKSVLLWLPEIMLLNPKKEIPLVNDPEIARKTEHRLVELLFQSSAFALYPLMALGIGFWWILTLAHPYFWPSVWLLVFGGLQGLRMFHIRTFLSKPES